VSIPAPAPSNPVSDHEDDFGGDEDGPEVEDSEILADLPDDTDVRRSPPSYINESAQPLIPFHFCIFLVPRRSTSFIHV